MKKFVRLLLTVVLLATMLCALCVPAFAEESLDVKEDTTISGDHTYFKVTVKNGCSLTIKSGASLKCGLNFEVEGGNVTIESGASVTCDGDFRVYKGGNITIESGASLTCDVGFIVDEGGSVTIESGASLTCNSIVSLTNGCSLTIKSGASLTCEGLNIVGIDTKGRFVVVENGASITVNGYMDVSPYESLDIGGILTGKLNELYGGFTLAPGGTVDLEMADGDIANTLVAQLQQFEESANAEQNSDGTYRVTAHRHVFADKGICCGEEYLKNTVSGDTASTLSEGNLTVVLCVACSVVFLAVGFFIGRKKKPALANSANSEDDE